MRNLLSIRVRAYDLVNGFAQTILQIPLDPDANITVTATTCSIWKS